MGLKRIVKKVVSAPVKAVQTVTKSLPTPLKTIMAPVTMTNIAAIQAKKNPAQFRAVMKTNAIALAAGAAAAPLAGVSMTTMSPTLSGLVTKGTALQASASKYQSYAAKLKGLQGASMSLTAKSQGELTGQTLGFREVLAKAKQSPKWAEEQANWGLGLTPQPRKRRVVYVSRATFARLLKRGY